MTKSHNYKMVALCAALLASAAALWENAGSAERGGGLISRTNDTRRQFTISAEDYWHLNPPRKERFDASGLLLLGGKILTVNDRSPGLHEIRLGTNHTAELVLTKLFSLQSLLDANGRRAERFDCEGLALDQEGNAYLSEESERAIYRMPSGKRSCERSEINWEPVKRYFQGGSNASFEGVAVGNGKLYVANERQDARIIVVDLATLKVEDSFAVDSLGFAFGGPHYSDLAFFEGKLFVLDRNHRCILEVNPATKKVEAEYSYAQMELNQEVAHVTDYPTGTMEGLAVDRDYFWLVTDNNGKGRFKAREDNRPTLFRCKRPARSDSR